jgi:hypothetical protein
MRGGPTKVGPTQKERKPWRGKDPGELRTRFQLKQLDRETDSRVEKNPEGGQNAKRGAALGTAYGHVRGKRLWRVTPGADPA